MTKPDRSSESSESTSRPEAGATKPPSSSNPYPKVRSRGRLPHWEQIDAVYFVTFRLADSLPRDVLDRIRSEAMERNESEVEVLVNERVGEYLDRGAGVAHMNQPEIASLVQDALLHFDGDRYVVHAWCIMPNHVHMVLNLCDGQTLSTVMHAIKSFTAHAANKKLGRHGPFWQREYYDRIIRDRDEYHHTVNYVLNNPVAAGLTAWPFVGRGDLEFERESQT